MRTFVLSTVLAVAVVVGMACKGPDALSTNLDAESALARGANVTGTTAADTLPQAFLTFSTTTDTNVATIGFTYTVTTQPTSGTVDSVVVYTGTPATAITSATAGGRVLCATVAGCTGGGTSPKITPGATYTALRNSMRTYGAQVVIYTTGTRPSNGAMRGTIYPTP